MSPSLSRQNIADGSIVYPEPASQGRFLSVPTKDGRADFPHVFAGQLRPAVILSLALFAGTITVSPSAFADTVVYIVGLSSKPQVGGINAGRDIAGVTNAETFGNLLTRYRFKYKPVTCGPNPIAPNLRVSIFADRSSPKPAGFSLVNTLPKSFPKCSLVGSDPDFVGLDAYLSSGHAPVYKNFNIGKEE